MEKHIACLVWFVCAVSGAANAGMLKDVYQQSLENDFQYRAAKAAYEAGKLEKDIGRSGLLPNIAASAQWQREDVESSVSSNELVTDPNDSTQQQFITRDTTSTGYSVSLTQPLFDLSAWHVFKRGAVQTQIAAAQYQADKQQLIIRTAETYFNVLRAIDLLETAKAEENANASQLEQTRKRFEVGLTAITEVHEAQAAFDNSRARRLLQEGNVGITFEALEVITGQAYQSLSPLGEAFPIAPPEPADRETWVAYAQENNITLNIASLRAKSAKQSANQLRAGHFPTVQGSLSYSDNTREVEGASSDTDIETTTARVTLSIPIFTGGGTSALRKQAASRFMEARENLFFTQRDTTQQARSLYLTVATDVATVQARAQAIISNNSALEATQAGYEVGTRDLVDVLIAQRSLFTAQSNYSDALYTYVINTLRLKQVAGTLHQQDLFALDQWLDSATPISRDVGALQ